MTTHHCPSRDEQITVEDCAGVVCNATAEQLAQCMECAHGEARRSTSPLDAAPRVELTRKAGDLPPVEVRVQLAESVAPATTRRPEESPWDYVSRVTGVNSHAKLGTLISKSQANVSRCFRRLAAGKSYKGEIIDIICARYHLDPEQILGAVVPAPSLDPAPARAAEDHTQVGEGTDSEIREAEAAQRQDLEPPAAVHVEFMDTRPSLEQIIAALRERLPGVTITITI